jgi:PAS domain S-box-containing protein
MAESNIVPQRLTVAIPRYVLAVAYVAMAVAPGIVLQQHGFRGVELPLFLFAIALASWNGGIGPAVVSMVLSILCFIYFFALPLFAFRFTPVDLPALLILIGFAMLITHFSATRRRVEAQLLQARDALQIEVAERTQQANLLNLTHDTIFVRDMSDVITYWNRGAQEMYGWTAEEAMGKHSHQFLRTVFPVPPEEIASELNRTGRWEGELKHARADGSEVVVSSRWSLQRDEQGRSVATLETNNDITSQKRREEEIRGLNLQLEKRSIELESSNKELEAFAYSVSHDLRAPLRHMVGYAELLRKSAEAVLDDKSRRYVTNIQEAAKRMGILIDDLLAFSRIGRVETQKTLVNLEQLAKDAVQEVRQETLGRDVEWKIGALPNCFGDRSMLRLVLVNLLSNAVKFTRGRLAARIEIGVSKESDHDIEIFVRDNGVGFDMKYVDKLFGVFQRLHSSDKFEGTGIGLATVQRIIHRHGGKVRAEGILDGGATIFFTVPKSKSERNL